MPPPARRSSRAPAAAAATPCPRQARAARRPNLDDAQPAYALVVERVTNGSGRDAVLLGSALREQIKDVAAYVSSTLGLELRSA